MKNNRPVLLVLLVSITLLFVLMTWYLVNRKTSVMNQTAQNAATTAPSRIPGPIKMTLQTDQAVTAGKLFPVDIAFSGMTKSMVAVDVLLTYDPTILEFVDTQKIHDQYLNPRKIVENNRLVLSFIEKATAPKDNAIYGPVTLGQALFRAKKAGTVTILPILNEGPRSSMVFVEGNQMNELGTAPAITVVIK